MAEMSLLSWLAAIIFALTIFFGRRLIYKVYIKWRKNRLEKMLLLDKLDLPRLMALSGTLSRGEGLFAGKLRLRKL